MTELKYIGSNTDSSDKVLVKSQFYLQQNTQLFS